MNSGPDNQIRSNSWTFYRSLGPGELGHIVYLHGALYSREYGYDIGFEAYVARGLAEFIDEFDPARDALWHAKIENNTAGFVAIVGCENDRAQLRWYFVEPEYRGIGLGKALMTEALAHCRDRKFKKVFLWTTSELVAAAHIYVSAGFVKTETNTHFIWGKKVTEEKYELNL